MSWFRRTPPTRTGIPSAWRFGGPTSNTSVDSTSVLTAAASRVTTEKVKRGKDNHETWQGEAWAMYDMVGELRYVSNAIAGRMEQAVLYVEKDGVRQDDPEKDEILGLITSQMVGRLGLNLYVAGAGYLAGLPRKAGGGPGDGVTSINGDASIPAGEIDWLILSTLEVKRDATGKVTIRDVEYKEADIYLEKIWDPHPARWEDADSPVRSALPVLRELVGLTQHVSAQIDSRLAGAGVYWIPNEILSAGKVLGGDDAAQTTFSDNAVLNAIMNGMLLPMEDRSNASSVVPTLLGGPGDAISKIRFDTFATPFDAQTKDLREEAIRRLGLNLDAPPELLLGMGDANHWGMWLVRDEVVQTHVAPRLDLLCDALTLGFYQPIKEQQGDPDAASYVVKADVSGLVQRPNRLADASGLHAVNVVSDKALREAGGFDDTDAPSSDDRAIAVAIQVATQNPQLLDNMPEIVAAVKSLLDGTPESGTKTLESAREPGTLKPLVPANARNAPTRTAPNGTPTAATPGQEAPLAEADAAPGSGPPVG